MYTFPINKSSFKPLRIMCVAFMLKIDSFSVNRSALLLVHNPQKMGMTICDQLVAVSHTLEV
ncbi:hypothetical protein L4C33_20760 [Vibrio makurazakiensis]|uniref:hypothetical protein n=1 Tax=Vibrio makurazakiensis TaxID=2910250 RepID=UPI003D0F4C2E